MRIKLFAQFMILAMLLGGSVSTLALADEVGVAKAQKIIADAEFARKKAASVKGEWRDTGALIDEAKAALEKGDTVAAMKLAAQAHKQGVMGYQQAMSQQALHMPPYLKYQ